MREKWTLMTRILTSTTSWHKVRLAAERVVGGVVIAAGRAVRVVEQALARVHEVVPYGAHINAIVPLHSCSRRASRPRLRPVPRADPRDPALTPSDEPRSPIHADLHYYYRSSVMSRPQYEDPASLSIHESASRLKRPVFYACLALAHFLCVSGTCPCMSGTCPVWHLPPWEFYSGQVIAAFRVRAHRSERGFARGS